METSSVHQTIALAACGAVTALGRGIEPLEHAVRHNQGGLRPGHRLTGKSYQSQVGCWVPEEVFDQLRAESSEYAMSRTFLLAHEALRQIEESSASLLRDVPPSRRGLVLSTTKAEVEALEKLLAHAPCPAQVQRHIHPALLAADLASVHEVRGPVQCVSAACISGLLAIQQGASLIQNGRADLVFVAGVDIISHFVLAGFTTLKSLDPAGCQPFDQARVGLSLGEGAGAVLLARPELAQPPILLVSGWGTSNDANHLTGPSRDGGGLALAIRRALAKASVAPDAIDYIHAHGTGTVYNDAMESAALRLVFGENVPAFSSSKGMLGHTLGAAGILETIICQIAMRLMILPGTPRLRTRDPAVPASLLSESRPVNRLQHVLKINCGFGGTNSALILERGPA